MKDKYILDESVKQRIISNSTPNDDGCWIWNKRIDCYGYAKISVKRKTKKNHGNATHDVVAASRISYTIFNGDIPEGLLVRHTCDDPSCVNPEHLLVGTQADNKQDAIDRNRLKNIKKKTNVNYKKMAVGRKKKVLPDGSWTWEYPEDTTFIKDQPGRWKRYLK